MAGEPAYRIESVDKALRLLHMFGEKSSWTVSEASEALGVAPSTAHRLMAMLQWHGFAHQNPGSKAYVPGRAMLAIGLAALRELAVLEVARPEIEELAEKVEETVHLIVLQGARTLIVDAVEAKQIVRVGARIGGSAPPNCVSAGKVLLSAFSDRQVRTLLGPDPLPTMTENSAATLAELLPQLEEVRRQGYATNFSEHEVGASAVAVPIYVPSGVTPAALTVNAPAARMPPERIPSVIEAAKLTAAAISAKLERPDSGRAYAQGVAAS